MKFKVGDEVRIVSRKDFEGSSAIVDDACSDFYTIIHKDVIGLPNWSHLEGRRTHGWRDSQLELFVAVPDETEAFFV